MSVKIHGGRIISAPIGRAYEMLLAVRPEAVAMGESMQARWMVRHAVELIDKAALDGGQCENPLFEAWKTFREAVLKQKASNERDPRIDLQFEVWLFPLRNRTLMMVQSEQREMQDWVDALPFVNPYGYWDNTDRDDDVDARSWNRRRRDWMEVLPHGSAPSDRCLNLVMFNETQPMPPSDAEARPHIPPVKDRIKAIASRMHLNEIHRRLVDEHKASEPDWNPKGFETYFAAVSISRTETDRQAEIEAEITPMIRKVKASELMPGRKR